MAEIRSRETMSSSMREANHYHDWVFDSFARFLRRGRALEIGSGHGKYARRIARHVDELVVSDIDPTAIEEIKHELADVLNVRYLVMDGLDARVLDAPLDNVVLVNVLEHIDDDRALLKHCYDSLREGGVLVVYVPAFPLLYSQMDAGAGHFRRYTRSGLSSVVEAAGFEITELKFVNAIGFFGWLANKWTKSSVDSSATNVQVSLYNRIVPFARRFDRLLPFLGQSLLVVGTKTRD